LDRVSGNCKFLAFLNQDEQRVTDLTYFHAIEPCSGM
jgi:hypothetical protein